MGAMTANGYGNFWTGSRNVYAHRYALMLIDTFDAKMNGLHKCANKLCVRVHADHVYAGTEAQNKHDALVAGTFTTHNTKIDAGTAEVIREQYNEGTFSYAMLAFMYNVSTTTIKRIIHSRYIDLYAQDEYT
jgi:hypothetical protein